MPNNLFSLFDDRLKSARDLVASDPQTLETIAAQEEEQERILKKIKQFEESVPKIDYSDFSNFVFFNSALDYFNLTGEKILNEYPYDGTVSDIEGFTHALDGYQRHVLENWPACTGHLRFNPAVSASWVKVEDVGTQDGLSRSTFITPGTGSFSLEFWFNSQTVTGSNDIMVIAQKVTGSGDGFTAYLTGSRVGFRMVSGSVTSEVFAPFSGGVDTFFSCVFDRSVTPTLLLMTGSTNSFPVPVTSASSGISGQMYVGPTAFTIGSGSLSGKVTRPLTGSLDQVSVWGIARQLADVSSSFNTKLYAQKGLLGLWRFNESGSITNDQTTNAIVFDHSGRRLNGRIQNYFGGIRGSGSLILSDRPDPILLFQAPEVQDLVIEQQTSGSAYDRNNDNLILNLLPEAFFRMEEYRNTTVLQDFVFVLARQFDFIKQRIDQFVNVLRSTYSGFDETPDALLPDIAKYFGWEFTGNFLNAEAFQYILGKNVLKNMDSNRELDKKLYEIKNEFWRRTLINLMYIYKTKGTRESVEALLRIYGVNKNFVRLKEYGYLPYVGVQTHRIHAEKSAYALIFYPNQAGVVAGGSLRAALGFALGGSHSHGNYLRSDSFQGTAESVEARVLFATSTTSDNPAAITSGSIWSVDAKPTVGSPFVLSRLTWFKDAVSSTTGTLVYSGSEGVVSASNLPIFNGEWYNIVARRDRVSGTLNIDVRHLDYDTIDYTSTTSVSASLLSSSYSLNIYVGATGAFDSQMFAQEVRVWDKSLTPLELDDHALNFQSFGVTDHEDIPKLKLHWRLNENVYASSAGTLLQPALQDVTSYRVSGSGFFFTANEPAYEGFLFDYNYIAPPEFGWNEEKIRVYNQDELKPAEMFHDTQAMALEFNMVDALNEDISQAISTMDDFNNYIGMPANRYRGTYPDLVALRKKYFARLQGRLNFRVFADMLEFFDRSFISMIQRLLPARTIFLGEEFVVESHMLERSKLQWNYRRQPPEFAPVGSIAILDRF